MENTVRLPAVGASGPTRRRSSAMRSLARLATAALVVCAVVALALVGGLGLYGYAHAERIYEGVAVAGVDLGGMTEAKATAVLKEHFAAYANAPLTLTAGEQRFAVKPADAGAELDPVASAAEAFAFGRSASIWERSRAWSGAFFENYDIAPQLRIDSEVLDARLRELAPRIVRAPVDASIEMSTDGAPALVQDEPGVSLDLSASRAAVARAFGRLDSAPVSLVTHPIAAVITAEQVAPSLEGAQKAVAAPLELAGAGERWTV